MRGNLRRLAERDDGAVAPTVALSLFALIAAGGVAFDYARMASLDTELQNAADQAALAAASQLTGDDDACARAARAAGAAVGGTDAMVVNRTLLANDGEAVRVTTDSDPSAPGGEDELLCNATGNIRFYKDIDKSEPATTDAEAKFVEVQVNPRASFYALTPVVGAFQSGPMIAIAFASLAEAYCKVPPVMICNPQETATNLEFDFEGLNGVGLRLVSVGSGTGGWAPGNFGYLDMPGLANGAPGLREGLGWGIPPTDCIQASGLDTKPGATVTVTDSINTRFDVYSSSGCPAGGTCPASVNSVKDVRRPANATGGNACRLHNNGWQLPSGYYGSGTVPATATAALADTVIPASMGHPRDMCHSVEKTAAGACVVTNPSNGQLDYNPIGDGVWDRDAYFRTNYVRTAIGDAGEAVGTRWTHDDWVANLGTSTPRRYDVYLWEIANRGDIVDGVTVLGSRPAGATGGTLVGHDDAICSASEGNGPGWVPDDDTPDRRKITVAIANCLDEGVNGSSDGVQTIGWLEAFIVEPSVQRDRSNAGDVYVEVIGLTTQAVQLVSKKVPYLIE